MVGFGVAKQCAIRRVAIVGGTHGNEFTGAFVVRHLEAMRSQLLDRYSKLEITTVLANVEAHRLNKRFVDEDLNRQFSAAKLAAPTDTYESGRAQQLNALLGPKADPQFDLVIDLHTSTAAMGTTIICDAWDPWALRAAAWVLTKQRERTFVLHNAIQDRDQSPYLATVGKHALQIECGPTPQGVLRHDVVENTEAALFDILDFLDREDAALPDTVDVYTTAGSHDKLAWPVDEDGFPTAIVHKALQDRDYEPLRPGDPVFVSYDGTVIDWQGDDTVYPIFINEGGYYYASSGRGIGLTRRITLPVPPP